MLNINLYLPIVLLVPCLFARLAYSEESRPSPPPNIRMESPLDPTGAVFGDYIAGVRLGITLPKEVKLKTKWKLSVAVENAGSREIVIPVRADRRDLRITVLNANGDKVEPTGIGRLSTRITASNPEDPQVSYISMELKKLRKHEVIRWDISNFDEYWNLGAGTYTVKIDATVEVHDGSLRYEHPAATVLFSVTDSGESK